MCRAGMLSQIFAINSQYKMAGGRCFFLRQGSAKVSGELIQGVSAEGIAPLSPEDCFIAYAHGFCKLRLCEPPGTPVVTDPACQLAVTHCPSTH